MVVLKLILSFALSLPAYAVYKVLRVVYRELTSPIRRLPGPPSRSGHWLQGDLGSTLEDSDRWADLYGPTMQCRGALGASHRFIVLSRASFSFLRTVDATVYHGFQGDQPLSHE
jgi:hypothetical protein